MRNLALYGLIGCLAASVDAAVFYLLAYVCGLHVLVANCVSVLSGMAVSFALNRKYNFKVEDHVVRRGMIFLAVGLSGLLLSQAMLAIGQACGLDAMPVKVASIAVVAVFQFTLNKLLSFGIRFD